ncbi:MAG: hypothetical protein DWQ08_08590 [Proteobacteria bacterium]|nr:MAG: hypothetical protein DWQ08_08590 [Pseudomonadota bacterium]
MIELGPQSRRALQAILYEGIAVLTVTPAIAFAFGEKPLSSFFLSLSMSTIALIWNFLFNTLFELWESRQARGGRSPMRRFAHGVGFEGGLTILLVPVMAIWLDIPYLEAFVANLGFLVFFFFYTIGFTWSFDRVFGLPASALRQGRE